MTILFLLLAAVTILLPEPNITSPDVELTEGVQLLKSSWSDHLTNKGLNLPVANSVVAKHIKCLSSCETTILLLTLGAALISTDLFCIPAEVSQ